MASIVEVRPIDLQQANNLTLKILAFMDSPLVYVL